MSEDELMMYNGRLVKVPPINDNFMMDMENHFFKKVWGERYLIRIPKGNKRYLDQEWSDLMKEYIDDNFTALELTFDRYVKWVENGGGDEWFQD